MKSGSKTPKNKQTNPLALTLSVVAHIQFAVLIIAKYVLQKIAQTFIRTTSKGIGSGKTVLVTTGRQAKTLHTVRALKEVGAKVIVTDYEEISASALSMSCDGFLQLPSIECTPNEDWINHFQSVIEKYNVDMVIPVSTINEVLLLGLTKTTLKHKLPNTTFFCPDLETALLFDDRSAFANLCVENNIPAPQSGTLTSRHNLGHLAAQFPDGIIVKRIDSSVNRSEEIVRILPNQSVPACVNPSVDSRWQWQHFVTGTEKSVWYICDSGKVTFMGCYFSKPDLVGFDPAKVPEGLDVSLKKLISKMRLTGQFAFDFIECSRTSQPYVIECNPRSSSVLETVSTTPLWGEAFFNVDVTPRTVTSHTGFLYHTNCWPFSPRREGHFQVIDPFPFFAAQIAWPLQQISEHGFTEQGYKHIDVNICKIVVPGPSKARNIDDYRHILLDQKLDIILDNVKHIDHLLLDASFKRSPVILSEAQKHNVSVTAFISSTNTSDYLHGCDIKVQTVPSSVEEMNKWFSENVSGETRLLLGEHLCTELGYSTNISWRLVSRKGGAIRAKYELPIRNRAVLHVLGSTTSDYYKNLSQLYAIQSIENLEETAPGIVNVAAIIHQDGTWSVETKFDIDYWNKQAKRISFGEALNAISRMHIDIALPHMFDYEGLTVYRSMLDVVGIPLLGNTGDALALSTHKGRTIAIARQAEVPVAPSEILHKGDFPSMQPPLIIKPSEEDNSMGVTLVRTEEEIPKALDSGFQFGEELLCEKFIPLGKEIRVAVTENGDGDVHMLPVVEYLLPEESPIRTPDNKLTKDSSGKMTQTKTKRVMNLQMSAELRESLVDAATNAHKSLGCRDYSIYDFRVDPEDKPYMLESSLYCSFSPKSALVLMAESEGTSLLTLFTRMCDWAITRRRVLSNQESTTQTMGMKRQ